VTLNFDPFLIPQKGTLRLNFKGRINDKKLAGFYRYRARASSGYNMVAMFEPTEARNCFPCWDDPYFKTTFDFILVIPKSKTVLGNMVSKRFNFECKVRWRIKMKQKILFMFLSV